MRKHLFVIPVLIALVVLPGASVWEGAAAVSEDFQESGLFAATNSFPRNTVVDITNLETGKTVRVIVTSGLNTPGLLALISREAADAIGLRTRTIGRIRMTASQDPIAFSRYSDDYSSGDPDYDPLAAVESVYGRAGLYPPPGDIRPGTQQNSESPADVPVLPTESVIDNTYSYYSYTLIPSEERPPVSAERPPISAPQFPYAPYTLIPAEERPPSPAEPSQTYVPSAVPHVFSVPAVAELEKGKYYLQLGAYSHFTTVEYELAKIERGYPLTVQYVTVFGKDVYRILIGPVNQGEAGALLKKFQTRGYKDAFVRRG